jgi:hypothetical protein
MHQSRLVRSVSHPSRVHLDMETDDVEAEARRERLGAKRVHETDTWWVMEAPTGQRLRAVGAKAAAFAAEARAWE